jgi:hypothetical protein
MYAIALALLTAVAALVAIRSCQEASVVQTPASPGPAPAAPHPAQVDVYGCGVDEKFEVPPGTTLPLYEILHKFTPLPDSVNSLFVGTPPNYYYFPLSQVLQTNGFGKFAIRNGMDVVLAHSDEAGVGQKSGSVRTKDEVGVGQN